MKKQYILLTGLITLFVFQISFSQEVYQPYTAKAYWNEINRDEYRDLKQKQLHDEVLTNSEKKWLEQYEEYLGEYFEALSGTEKEIYFTRKAEWYAQADMPEIQPERIEKPKRDTELLLKHIGYSGLSGLTYGLMLSNIFHLNETETAGLTTIMAGGSMLYPVFSPQYNNINNNSLWLRSHGKVAGGLYGYSLGMAIYSDDIYKHREAVLSMSLISSFGLGIVGFRLGKQKDWSEGRVSLYQYYGYMVPALTSSILFASGYDELRGYGINILLSAPIGYLAANKVSQLADYSRGDITALVGLSTIGAAYGVSIMLFGDLEGESAILSPAISTAASSAIGQYVLRNTRLSRPEGRRVNYAAIGGGLIGFGMAFLIDPGNEGWYLFFPATTSLIGYSVLLNYYKKNQQAGQSSKNDNNPMFHINLHPENLIYSRIDTRGYIPPLVSANLIF